MKYPGALWVSHDPLRIAQQPAKLIKTRRATSDRRSSWLKQRHVWDAYQEGQLVCVDIVTRAVRGKVLCRF